MTQTDERTHHNGKSQTSRSKITGLDIKNVFAHRTLWRPHRDDPGPKPTWWHPSSRAKEESLRFTQRKYWSFHFQRIRGSPGHARDDSGARPTYSNAVPRSKIPKIGSHTHQNGEPQASGTKTVKKKHANIFTKRLCGEHIVVQKPTWWHPSSRSNVGCLTYMRIYAGRFPSTRIFARRGHCWQSWRPDQRTPMRENTTTMTHTSNHVLSRTEIHKHTKHKSLSCKRCPQPGAVATTSWRLKTIANSEHASSRSNAAVANTHGQQQLWSCPSLHNLRVSRENVADHGGWTNHSNAVPNSTMTQIN